MDEGFFVLLGLAALAAFVLGPIGFFLTLGARARLTAAPDQIATLETRIRDLERARVLAPPPPTPSEAPEPEAVIEAPVAAETEPPPDVTQAAAEATPGPEAATKTPPADSDETAPRPRRSLEEAMGARWTVWVGGVALALGALLMVRYSIEQGFFGPGVRVLMGMGLAAALVATGEWMRRREPGDAPPAGGIPIPAVLTAAGTVAAFGSIYAAHALYGFIGPALAFLLLGATGVACMFAAALHGPELAGLGLAASLATPLLVDSHDPNPWPVVPYVAVVAAAAYGLARVRLWLWLAQAAAGGGALWGLAFLSDAGSSNSNIFAAGIVHICIQAAMACFVFDWETHRRTPDDETAPDKLACTIPGGFALLMGLMLLEGAESGQLGTIWMAGATVMIALMSVTAAFVSPAAPLAAVAGLLAFAALRFWPTDGADNTRMAVDLTRWAPPSDAGLFGAMAMIWGLAVGAISGWRLLFGPRLPLQTAAVYAGAATLTPLAALVTAWMRIAQGSSNYLFAALAAGLAVIFTYAAHLFRERLAGERLAALDLGLGAFASAAIAALALGFVMALDGGVLTVALALAALGCAYVAIRLDIPALRWCVAGLGAAVAVRLAWEPRIVGAALGTTPIFNWLLFGYGVPAAAFGYAARMMRRANGVEDTPVKIAQALAILFSAFLTFFEIRHFINAGDPYAASSRLIEQGLFAIAAYGFAIVLTRLDATRSNPVFRFASLAFGIASFATTMIGLGLVENPLFSNEDVEGGAFFNALLLSYLLPALLALVLSRVAVGVRPNWYLMGARIATILLIFGWLTLETRRLFRGPDIGLFHYIFNLLPMSEGEIWAYSAVWLGFGLLLLAYGLWRSSKEARLASAIFVLLSVLKVFLFDLAGLEGIVRALSFIGLGLVLIGIGLVYQKFVFGPQRRST